MNPILFLALLYCAFAGATIIDCSSACQNSASKFLFEGSDPSDTFYFSQCTNYHRVQSIFVCMRTYCDNGEIKAGLQDFSAKCKRYGSAELLPWSIISNISDEDARAWSHVGINDLGSTVIHNEPILISDSLYSVSFRTSAAWNESLVTRANYGYAMFGFFAGVSLIANMARLFHFVYEQRCFTRSASNPEHSSVHRTLSLAIKRHITVPALLTYHTAQPVGWWTIPQRLISLTIGAFTIFNIVLCCVNYDIFEGNLSWPDPSTQFWRYFSDRTGVISTANLPLLFAFGMRNNVLVWITGWDFLTCNMFHRWVSRVATIEAVLHSVGYTIECFLHGGKAEYIFQWSQQYWWMGAIATIAMSLLCGFSIYPIRNLFYELFLVLHIAFAIVFLVGMWYHVAMFDYGNFIWPCLAVWIIDRIIRFIRICYLNHLSFTATASYNAEADLIRISVPIRSSSSPKPGNHYYIYGLTDPKFWESHPFTLSTWSLDGSSSGQRTLTFLIRPYHSYTARLRDSLTKTETARSLLDGTIRTRIAIEGPYGYGHILENYNSTLFIMGGTGITVALSHIQALHELLTANEKTPLHNIHLVWAVRSLALFQDVYTNELEAWLSSSPLSQRINFKVDVYLTTRRAAVESNAETLLNDPVSSTNPSSKSTKANNIEVTPLLTNDQNASTPRIFNISGSGSDSIATSAQPRISVLHQRPPIRDLVLTAASNSCVQSNRLVVVCCGPAAMADDSRAAVVAAYAQGHEGVDLYSEAFNW